MVLAGIGMVEMWVVKTSPDLIGTEGKYLA